MVLFKLNSIDYVGTQRGFRRRKKDVFAEVFAQTGSQVQQDITAYGTEVLGPWIHGIGRTAIPVGVSRDSIDHQMYQDGFVDARWPTGVYAGLLLTSVTDTGLERLWGLADFKGQLEGMWTNDDANTNIRSVQYDAATPDWDDTDGADIEPNGAGGAVTGLDFVPFKEKLVSLLAFDDNHRVYHSTDTVTWTVASTPITANLFTGNVTTNEDIDGGKLQEIGGRLAAVIWDEDAGTVTVYSSIDAAVWIDETVEVSSGGGAKGVAKVRAPDRLDHLIFCTREGLQDVDVSAGTGSYTITSIDSPLSAHDDNGRNMTMHNGELWYPQGVSTSDVFQVWRMFVRDGEWVHEPTEGSPHLRDGLPTDMLGTVTAMASSGGFCYIAVGGGATGRLQTIFCHNGLGWHPLIQNTIENRIIHTMAVSSESDGVVRIHFDDKTGTNDSEPYIVEHVNSHPSSGVSIPRAGTSQLSLPFADAGLPTQNKIWIMLRAKVDDLGTSTSATHIPVTYGKDDQARTVNTSLDNEITDDATHDPNDFYSNAKELNFTTQEADIVTNGAFASDTGWTKNSWTIAAGVADSASAQSTTMSQTPITAFEEGVKYEVVFTVTQSAGSVLISIGGTDGTARSTGATFTETIVAGAGQLIEVKASSFTGTVDNITIKKTLIPTGEQSISLGLQLTLTQTTPSTPVLQALELVFKAAPSIIEEWDLEIDIQETSHLTGVSPEVIIANLQNAESNSVLVPLTYGQLGTKYVSVDNIEFRPEFENPGAAFGDFGASNRFDLRVSGTVLITVSQVVT